MARQMDAARLVVDMRNPQMFLAGIGLGEAIGEESPGRIETIETQRGFGTLMEHSPCIGEGGQHGDVNRIGSGATFSPFRRDAGHLPRAAARLG